MKKKLRIAQIAPFWFDVPPKSYGGTERIISYITEELVKRGHDVTLFASEGSKTKARLISPISSKLFKYIKFYPDLNFQIINTYINSYIFKQAQKFDIIHSHANYLSFYFCDFVSTPVIHTLHNQLPRNHEPENEIFRKYRHLNFIGISNEFRTHFNLNYIATVYHGIDLKYYPFNPKGGNYLFWIGRASKHKGEDEAIKVAQKTNKKLILALSIRPDTFEYYKKYIKPLLNNDIIVKQNIGFTDTWKYYSNARAFIFPVIWKEPFGLIMPESMACGTPVIAYANGSVPEIIIDGVTGYIINQSDKNKQGNFIIKKTGIDGLCEAVERIYSMTKDKYLKMRQDCRKHVEQNFVLSKMVDNYEKIYYRLQPNK